MSNPTHDALCALGPACIAGPNKTTAPASPECPWGRCKVHCDFLHREGDEYDHEGPAPDPSWFIERAVRSATNPRSCAFAEGEPCAGPSERPGCGLCASVTGTEGGGP